MSRSVVFFTNQLLDFGSVEAPDLHRILHIDEQGQRVVLFAVDQPSALPVWLEIEPLQQRIEAGVVFGCDVDTRLPDLRSDAEISEASRRVRDRRLEVIRPLVLVRGADAPVLDASRRGPMVQEAVARHDVAKDKIYAWLRLWWRYGQLDNALLPAFGNCGTGPRAVGKVKRGRPLSTSKDGAVHIGMNVDERTRRLIIRGSRMFWSAKPGGGRRTKMEAYQLTLQSFFYKRLEMKDGVLTPIVRENIEDDNRLPTFEQWDYWVEKYLREKDVLAKRYGERDMALRRRPVLGSTQGLSEGPGQLYLVDATVADLYLVSSYDPCCVIGRPILYLVVDHYSRMIAGLHVGLEGPNWNGVMMALENAFTDKVAFCTRYGVAIEQEDWPCSVVPAQLCADRGELVSRHADWTVPGLRMIIQNTPSYRADFKSFVEGQFKITNEKGIKRMPGWVDKLRDRGAPDYRYDATLDLKSFTEMVIRLALHNNRARPIASNIPVNFPLADSESPVPIELWEWGLLNATPSLRRFPPAEVRRNLLPTFKAITSRQGLAVFGGRLRYTCDRAIKEGWFIKTSARGGVAYSLSIDPRDVSEAYLRDASGGLEPCELIPADRDRFAGRSLPDVEDQFDRERQREAGNRKNRIQRDADLAATLDAIKERAAEKRRDALTAEARSRPRIDGMRPMRKAERDLAHIEQQAGKGSLPDASCESRHRSEEDDTGHIHIPD